MRLEANWPIAGAELAQNLELEGIHNLDHVTRIRQLVVLDCRIGRGAT